MWPVTLHALADVEHTVIVEGLGAPRDASVSRPVEGRRMAQARQRKGSSHDPRRRSRTRESSSLLLALKLCASPFVSLHDDQMFLVVLVFLLPRTSLCMLYTSTTDCIPPWSPPLVARICKNSLKEPVHVRCSVYPAVVSCVRLSVSSTLLAGRV